MNITNSTRIENGTEISLNFFSLKNQNIEFPIFRKKYIFNTEVPSGLLRYRLPESSSQNYSESNEQSYSDYLISFEKCDELEEKFVNFKANFELSKEFLYRGLLSVCKQELHENEYFFDDSFNRRKIYFIINIFPEGKQVVWVEPYYLKIDSKFGFLTDFKFVTPKGTKSTRRIQQLSLSLDKDGRSNKNSYLDRYEFIQKFLIKFSSKLFPFYHNEVSIDIEKRLYPMQYKELKTKEYVFSENHTSKSQFNGLRQYGPKESINEIPKLYFLYQSQEKQYADELFKALRGDTYKNTFPGMNPLFNYSLTKENVGGKSIESFDPEEIEEAINSILDDAHGRKVLPILITPFSNDGLEASTKQYYRTKYVFLNKKIVSQFVSTPQLRVRDQLKWSVSNIGLQIFAKMGGIPWTVVESGKRSLIIGISQAHEKIDGVIRKYFAYSVLTESSGVYKSLQILGKDTKRDNYLKNFRNNFKKLVDSYFDEYDSFVIHTTFAISYDEIQIIETILEEYKNKKQFVVMKINDKNKYFGFSHASNSLIPYESSYIKLSVNEYILWFEGLQYHNPNIVKRYERPINITFLYPKHGLSETDRIGFLQDALNISGANWRGFNAKSLPISIFYAYRVATFYREMSKLKLENIDWEILNPWFL